MLTISDHQLVFHFPDVHLEAVCCVSLHRQDPLQRKSLIPWFDSDRVPLFHLDDYASVLPASWVKRGGVLAPVRPGEHLSVHFGGNYSFAVKIASGKINAITGTIWKDALDTNQKDYLVSSWQGGFSGFQQPDGTLRKFVVAPMGLGETVEEQTTGVAEFGGLQIIAYPQKAAVHEHARRQPLFSRNRVQETEETDPQALGLGAGETVKERVKKDDDPQQWDTRHSSRCFVHLLSEEDFLRITRRRINGRKALPISMDYWRHRLR